MQADKLTRRAWGTLLVLCGALFLDALDVSMIGVALPSIRADLNMSTSSLQWVVSAYVLGYGGLQEERAAEHEQHVPGELGQLVGVADGRRCCGGVGQGRHAGEPPPRFDILASAS